MQVGKPRVDAAIIKKTGYFSLFGVEKDVPSRRLITANAKKKAIKKKVLIIIGDYN